MKIVHGSYYVHISDMDRLKKAIKNFEIVDENIKKLPKNFEVTIIKYNKKTNSITFINSYDWDSVNEPSVGDAWMFNIKNPNGKFLKEKGQIYHHKWCFVNENYTGFDIEKSKKRSDLWVGLCDQKTRRVIGYRKRWDEFLILNNIEK